MIEQKYVRETQREMKETTACCFSGHRPQKLPWGWNETDPACTLIYHVSVDAAGNVVIWGMEMNPGTQKIYFGSGNG